MKFNIIAQNIGGSKICNARQGGGHGLKTIRLWAINNKPHIIILSETRIADRTFEGKGVFRGYYMAQHSSSGQNSKGVIVYARAQVVIEDEYSEESDTGHYTIGVYNIDGERCIVVGMYGPSESSDRIACEIYNRLIDRIELVRMRSGVEETIIAGDMNLHIDVLGLNPKGRACRLVREYMAERNIIDTDQQLKQKTWRRPGNRTKKSRIDYILVSERLSYGKYRTVWTKFDHAMLEYKIESNVRAQFRAKDWVLASKEFIDRGRKKIEETLLDHSKEFRHGDRLGRERYINKRTPREYEKEIEITDVKEGIYYSHILTVLVSKLSQLQKNIQIKKSKDRKAIIENYNNRLKGKHKELDEKEDRDEDTQNVQEEIKEIQNELYHEIEAIDSAKRVTIENFEIDKKGKNNAYSFVGVKEPKGRKQINKIKIGNNEIVDKSKILEALQEK